MAAGDLITDLYQVEWRNTLWGAPATTVGLTNIQGWLDTPSLRGQNADRPGRHGTYPGRKRAGERVIEVELTVVDDDPTALNTINDVTALDEDPAEEELAIWAGTYEPQLVYARLERRAVPTDHDWSLGHHRATLQWVATDPRRYSITEHTSPVIGLPTTTAGGLAFPDAFPLNFGSGSGVQTLTITNAGTVPTWPTITITGPVTGPIVTNATTGQVLQFAASFEVGAGQQLVIDTDARAATLAGVSRSDALVIREWFPLNKGDTTITFRGQGAYDPAAGLYVTWRDAWL